MVGSYLICLDVPYGREMPSNQLTTPYILSNNYCEDGHPTFMDTNGTDSTHNERQRSQKL